VLSVGVGGHGAHSLGPILIQRLALDHPQASEWLIQNQATEIISDLLRLWKDGGIIVNGDWPFNSALLLRNHKRRTLLLEAPDLSVIDPMLASGDLTNR